MTAEVLPADLGVALDQASSVEVAYHDLTSRALVAIGEASNLQEGADVLGKCKVLAYLAEVKKLNNEACVKGSALAVAAERRMGQLIGQEREAGRLARQGRPLAPVFLSGRFCHRRHWRTMASPTHVRPA